MAQSHIALWASAARHVVEEIRAAPCGGVFPLTRLLRLPLRDARSSLSLGGEGQGGERARIAISRIGPFLELSNSTRSPAKPEVSQISMISRTQPVYGLLIALWCLVVVWQVVEHGWTKEAARSALINRSRDITRTLEAVIQSQRRFGGLLVSERLESALKELVKSGELTSVALPNAAGEVVASAGPAIDVSHPRTRATRGHLGSP